MSKLFFLSFSPLFLLNPVNSCAYLLGFIFPCIQACRLAEALLGRPEKLIQPGVFENPRKSTRKRKIPSGC